MSNVSISPYESEVTREPQRIAAAQELRQRVFATEFRRGDDDSERDSDTFDWFCDHLLITHRPTRSLVGTCRMLRPEQAVRAGHRYSEQFFDLSPLHVITPDLLEIGRLAVHPEHRNGAVIAHIWAGILGWARTSQCRWFGGCTSVTLRDGGHQAAATRQYILDRGLMSPQPRIHPHVPWTAPPEPGPPVTAPTPLLRGYFRLGAVVAGEPAHDVSFGSADFFVLLDLAHADQRYVDRFTGLAS
ncbi:GNAT family N-acetyltransferase [Paractinoplanes toevensis]|uniref:GNAT family N-acetyltransferase n=1 Tax=Paractinoplanes toevensis TaxID=571911 RepID=A0A919TBK8_9ACTN|nr:GNAT family N-acyltransferase [Actinoplanes toevensis]GIM92994.1 hypothetical protein Ato02nite_047870 [Actinoplanes toevensis]